MCITLCILKLSLLFNIFPHNLQVQQNYKCLTHASESDGVSFNNLRLNMRMQDSTDSIDFIFIAPNAGIAPAASKGDVHLLKCS